MIEISGYIFTTCPDCAGSCWRERDKDGWNVESPFERCGRCGETGVIKLNPENLKTDNFEAKK